jgi:AcrR family transcriptional regulator
MCDDPAKRPRTKPPEIRLEELVDAAQRLFLEKGFSSTSVAEIVKLADVAKGTFYLYFQTKEDVLAALQERFLERFTDALDTAFEKSAGHRWPERLDQWMTACVSFYLANIEFHDLVFHEFALSRSELRKANPIVNRLDQLLEAGRFSGEFDVDDTKLTAVMLFSAMHGAVDEVIASGEQAACDNLFKHVIRLCRRAVVMCA